MRINEERVEQFLDVLCAIGIGCVGPVARLSERNLGPLEPGAKISAGSIAMVRREHRVTGLRDGVHQESRLGVTAVEAVRENDNRPRWRRKSVGRRAAT